MKQTFAPYIATWFGAGTAPVAQGTFGSLAALPSGYLIHAFYGTYALLAAALLAFLVGIWATKGYLASHPGSQDPKEVVIDEVSGQWLLLAFVPMTLGGYALGFILFRFFDIVKPWPVSWCDTHLHGAFGVMFDDIVAALMGIGIWYGMGYLHTYWMA